MTNYRRKGWKGESTRHSLASKGIKTKTNPQLKAQTKKQEMINTFESCVIEVEKLQKKTPAGDIPLQFRNMPAKSRAFAICTAKLGYQARKGKIIQSNKNMTQKSQDAVDVMFELDDFFLDKIQGLEPTNLIFNPELDQKIIKRAKQINK